MITGQLMEAMKQAAKEKDKARLSIIRLAVAAVQNKAKDLRRELSKEEEIQVISGLIKKGKESIEQFKVGQRDDLVAKEERELEVLQAFLPLPLTPEALEVEIAKAVEESGATALPDIGKVMKILMPRIAGRADGKAVNELVRKRLAG
ncbi:MAG: glutamyl-tRNA amidotransferase [Deltaproteobacteria bacterium RBG_16_54_18]|nr:MAG: glutamyl-tRNA amidotransferase [Deltaproteobacteria bacterium RBG_16_54_18]